MSLASLTCEVRAPQSSAKGHPWAGIGDVQPEKPESFAVSGWLPLACTLLRSPREAIARSDSTMRGWLLVATDGTTRKTRTSRPRPGFIPGACDRNHQADLRSPGSVVVRNT